MGSYNVETLNPDLQLKDTESAVRNKLSDLLTKMKEFKFATKLVLEFEKNRE